MSENNDQNKNLEQDLLTATATVGGLTYTFGLRHISMLEDIQLRERFSKNQEIQDPAEKAKGNYEINVDALAEFAVKVPELAGEPVSDIADPKAATRAFFEPFSGKKDWIAEFVIRDFQKQLVPSVSFL